MHFYTNNAHFAFFSQSNNWKINRDRHRPGDLSLTGATDKDTSIDSTTRTRPPTRPN